MTSSPYPLGVTPTENGVNVAVYSSAATRIELCLFDPSGTQETARIPLIERSGDIHHAHVPGVMAGALYGLRAHGPYDPANGQRFNPAKLLADPYAWAIDRRFTLHPSQIADRNCAADDADSAAHMPKGIVTNPDASASTHVSVPWRDTMIYELNVRAFTMLNPDLPEHMRGTFAGLAHDAPINHLKSLGISTIELMPAMAFVDERHLPALGLTNAWGYNPVLLGVPDPRLAPGGWREVRESVAALHGAGLEVILDVVLNHTGESDEWGATLAYRGLDNAAYYRLDPTDPRRYINDAGCGNCLALDRPHVVGLAMDMLRRWARAGIDGFRFDLATAMGRRADGFDPAAPLLTAIRQDPELSTLKIIAEPWDVGPGGYQLGRFPAAWGEWNDRYRDTVRRFWRGDAGMIGDLATRLAGSQDVFHARHRPSRSINFVTAHDGFTLADLVSYAHKHNEANGEANRDGGNDDHSWNHGIEGPAGDPAVAAARLADQKNLLATLMFSRGTPMLQMGAEFAHSQGGNNNAYAQDNATTWLDWSQGQPPLADTIATLTALRRSLPLLGADRFLTPADARWLRPDGSDMGEADWSNGDVRCLLLALSDADESLLIALNAGTEPEVLRLDDPSRWDRLFTTVDAAVDVLPPRSTALYRRRPPRRSAAATPETMAALADATGIAPGWWDHGGQYHATPDATLRALIGAMGLDASTQSAAGDSLAHLRATRLGGLPSAAHEREAQPAAIAFSSPIPTRSPPRQLTITSEDGRSNRVDLAPAPLAPVGDGWRTMLELPPLPAGRYTLTDDADRTCALTVAPGRCHLPPPGTRVSGLACQLYAMRSVADQGIGDLGTLAATMDMAARHGLSVVGINPLHALFAADPDRASPYHPSDRRFLDPLAIDLAGLTDLPESALSASLFRASAAEFAGLRARPTIDYAAVAGLKTACLRARHEAFRTAGSIDPLRAEHDAFVAAGGEHLRRFATFRALERQHAGRPWQEWGALADVEHPAVAAFAAEMQGDVSFELFCQWLASRQLSAAAKKGRAAGLGIGLYRDLAVGCAPDGGEVWADPAGFATGVSVGAPPDPFSAQGQNWCLPPPNPLTIADGGHARFRALITANMRHAGMLRIDHVMALTRLFWVPDGAKTAEGAYVSYPRDALLAELALESQRAACTIVGEDLGTVPEGFREALAERGVLTYRVLYFERQGAAFAPPETYPEQAVACASTHDLPPLAGWWQGTDLAEDASLARLADPPAAEARRTEERGALLGALEAAGVAGPEPIATDMTAGLAAAVHRFVATTPAMVAMVQADDLSGETVAINLPGTDRERPNWRRRLATPVEDLLETPLATAILAAMRAERP